MNQKKNQLQKSMFTVLRQYIDWSESKREREKQGERNEIND